MNRLRLIRTNPNPQLPNPYRVAQIVPMLQEAAAEWTPQKLKAYIGSGEVPREYIDRVVDHVKRDPSLITIQIEDFTAAIGQVYPALLPIITAPEGYRWIDLFCREITKQVLFSPFRSLFKGG